jgi:prepilin-type N-terminal cleavage/methylation domain-containing protein
MHRGTKGYTLIELIVVIVLLGLIFSIAAPRFRDAVLTDNLKTTTRRLIGLIKELRSDAIQKRTDQILFFDLESNMYWYGPADMTEEGRDLFRNKNAIELPPDVRITDVWTKGTGKKMVGELSIRFQKKGYAQQSAIHLESEDGSEFTLLLRPFLPEVKVFEKYIEFEDLS